MKVKEPPSREYLNQRLSYNQDDGKLIWKAVGREFFSSNKGWRGFLARYAGKEAGCRQSTPAGDPTNVTVRITVDGKPLLFVAHRLIAQIMGISIPDGMEIDHKDRNPWNNKWDNLRLATQSQNLCNRVQRTYSGVRRTLPKGVSIQHGRYVANVTVAGKVQYIGMFGSQEEAKEAYNKRAAQEHGEFFRP